MFYKYTCSTSHDIKLGETGVITKIFKGRLDEHDFVGVQWEEAKPIARHDCDGTCESGYGWYVRDDEVMLI